MAAFSVGSAHEYQDTLGNQGVLDAAGMERPEGSGAGGLDLVSELDPDLAQRLKNQLNFASDTASEAEKLLRGTLVEAAIDDIYKVQDYIYEELDGLQKLMESGSDEAILAALDHLDAYQLNLSTCVLIVDGDRAIEELYRDLLLGEALALFCSAAEEVAAQSESAKAVRAGCDAVEAELAKIQEAMEMIQDVALKAHIDIQVSRLTGGINKVVGPLKGFAKAAMLIATKGASYAKDQLYEQLRNGSSEGKSLLDDAQESADLLNEASEVELPDPSGLLEIASEANGYLENLARMKDAQELAYEGLNGVSREWKKLLLGPAPIAVQRGDVAKRFAAALSALKADRDYAEESTRTFREKNEWLRSQFPDRAERLG